MGRQRWDNKSTISSKDTTYYYNVYNIYLFNYYYYTVPVVEWHLGGRWTQHSQETPPLNDDDYLYYYICTHVYKHARSISFCIVIYGPKNVQHSTIASFTGSPSWESIASKPMQW